MSNAFYTLFSVIRLSSAQRIAIYRRMLVVATALGVLRLVEHLKVALAHEVETHGLLRKRKGKRRNQYIVPVKPIDVRADHLLSGVRSLAIGLASGLPPEHPIAVAVTELLEGIFPDGVGAVTGLQYVEQVATMERILIELRTSYPLQVALLGLGGKVELLAEITAEYRSAVDAGRVGDNDDEARAADERGHLYLLEVVGLILGEYFNSSDEKQSAAREELLAPLYEQIDIVRARRRAGRSSGESDRDSGAPGNDNDYDDMDDIDDIADDIDGELDAAAVVRAAGVEP